MKISAIDLKQCSIATEIAILNAEISHILYDISFQHTFNANFCNIGMT